MGRCTSLRGKGQQPGQPLWASYFLIHQGLLYHHTVHHGQPTKLLVPHMKVDLVMHPLTGHLKAQNTMEKIWDSFLWPGINVEEKNFCRQCCPQCLHTGLKKIAPTLLILLLIIKRGPPSEVLGLAGYYHRFVPNFSVASPLHPGHHGLCHLLPRGSLSSEGIFQTHHQGTGSALSQVGLQKDLLTAQSWEFQPGDHILLLFPSANCKFAVVECVSLITYHLQQPGK